MTATNFGDSLTDPSMKKKIEDDPGAIAMSAYAIAPGILFVIERPPGSASAASLSTPVHRVDRQAMSSADPWWIHAATVRVLA
ncbi:hypothetical protein SB748_24145 [Rhizobium sp. SIMBA_035]